jgi:hypothetical protein
MMAQKCMGAIGICGLVAVGMASVAVGQGSSDSPSVSSPYPQAGEKAPPGGGPATFPSNKGANTDQTNSSGACDTETLIKDAEYCFDANRAGYKDLFEGSCNKIRDTTEAGFFACQSQNESARKNYSSCSPEQQIDLVRSAGRNQHAYANLFACGF